MIIGIIQASGFSRRMNKDKLLMSIDGIPMIEKVIRSCKLSSLDDLIMVYRREEVGRIGERCGIKTVYNPNAHLGQSEALKVGIREAENADAYMFLVGDQPFINSELIDRLIFAYRNNDASIIVPYFNGKNGTPTIFSSKYKEKLLTIKGDKGGRDIIRNNFSLVKRVHIDNPRLGIDIDTLEDLK
ncbi:nucleotidyltransferase family protein [Schnuerera sp. xch1]|uniref:nucleotidyltransferase family protein n=1 Tax=Schnuerera sp. xch1 TaxID=2874283 RepID=UPI001CBEAD78|nr:nucleotidyltransferase family protein [Schnuerera sp. xch1]MBZ2175175.1 nucleotidyltransferase family protein [Schnuerera sp. xch1]